MFHFANNVLNVFSQIFLNRINLSICSKFKGVYGVFKCFYLIKRNLYLCRINFFI